MDDPIHRLKQSHTLPSQRSIPRLRNLLSAPANVIEANMGRLISKCDIRVKVGKEAFNNGQTGGFNLRRKPLNISRHVTPTTLHRNRRTQCSNFFHIVDNDHTGECKALIGL